MNDELPTLDVEATRRELLALYPPIQAEQALYEIEFFYAWGVLPPDTFLLDDILVENGSYIFVHHDRSMNS